MGKILETRELYKETINEVTKSVENWQAFLDSSSWNFKYDFDDQILIYAQRPNAKACASIEEWNTKLRRWIRKGSNGIFVQDKDENSKYPFRIVFDISDTYNARNINYKLWEVKQEYEKEIIDALEANFGEIYKENEINKTLPQAIYLSAYNMVEDNIYDYMELIKENKEGTKLEGLDEKSIENIVKVSTIASVSYMMMTRCGINAKEHIELQDISLIEYFNNFEIITTIGNAVSDIAEQGLRQIARTVFELQKSEKINNRTFEKNQNELYSNDENTEKGGFENARNNLYQSGRLQHPQYNNGSGEITQREIRNDEVTISEKTQQTDVHDTKNEQEASRTLDGDTGNSISTSITDSGRNGKTGESERRTESSRPNEMGTTYEQLKIDGRGTSNKGDNLHLNKNIELAKKLPSENEQRNIFEYAREQKPLMIKPNIVKTKNGINEFILHPEVPESARINFTITDDELGVGGLKEKYARNIEAIKVLKKCEEENRYANKDEQKLLSQYVGWGGLADVFNKDKAEWHKEYNELKELLNEQEYTEARESTLTSFYTPPIVIRAIYKVFQNMELKNANILEPSCRSRKLFRNVT